MVRLKPTSRASVAGMEWGVAQAIILSAVVGLFGSPLYVGFAGNVVWALIPMSGLAIGWALRNIEDAFSAAFVSQLVGLSFFLGILFLVPFSAGFGTIPGLVGIWFVNFIFSFGSSAAGGIIGEWLDPVTTISMDWRPIAIGFGLLSPVYASSLLTSGDSGFFPILFDWNITLILMAALTVTGVFFAILGLSRNRVLGSISRGAIIVGSLIVVILSVLFLNQENGFYNDCLGLTTTRTIQCSQSPLLGTEFLILGATLLIPAIAVLGILFPRHWVPDPKSQLTTG